MIMTQGSKWENVWMSNAPLNNGRRRFLTATTAVVGGLGAVAVAVPFIKSWNPSAKAKAAGGTKRFGISGSSSKKRVLVWKEAV